MSIKRTDTVKKTQMFQNAFIKIWTFLLLIGFTQQIGFAQTNPQVYTLSLKETIQLAQSDAPSVLLAKTRYTTNYWTYQRFLSNYKPQIDFGATLPNLNRSIQAITLPNGTTSFVAQSFMENSVNVSLSQNLTATGGTIFASTGLRRIDVFKTKTIDPFQSYLSTPINIGFQQPLFAFNALKWAKEIEPLAFEESTRAYSEEFEQVAYNATQFFFNVLTAQLNVEAALREQANADTLLQIGTGRYSVGKIAETELLQLELGSMRSESSLASAQLDVQTSMEALRNFLGIKENVVFNLLTPTDIPEFNVDADQALKWANQNRSLTLGFQRRLKEAEQRVAQAEGEKFNVDLFATLGLTQTGGSFGESYQNPLDQEQLRIGINVPIADWGKSKSRIEIAKSQKALEELNIELEKINFEREIIVKVQQFELVKRQVELALKTYEASQKRYDITQKRYLIGKIDVTELNISINEQENARQGYVFALQRYWVAHQELRGLTLYDFENQLPLIVPAPQ